MTGLTKYLRPALAALLAAAAFAACRDGLLDEPAVFPSDSSGFSDGVTLNDDGTLGITLRMEIPGMAPASTRAMGGTPNYDDLNLFLLVFEEGEGLEQYAQLKPRPHQADGTHDHSELVTFDLSLEPTEKNATIHLIATDQPDFRQQIVYGTEERVIASLYTRDNHEAYWQRIVPGSNIPSAEQADPKNVNESDPNKRYSEEAARKAQRIAGLMSHVPMIRNFCRVSLEVEDTGHFTPTGLYVLNTVDCGSVAPYVAGNPADRRFVDYFEEDSDPYEIKSYDAISAQDHIGTLPTGVQLINRLGGDIRTKSEAEAGEPVGPVYFYERPARVNSTERTYAVVRGIYYDEKAEKEEDRYKEYYYKIDLGFVRTGDIIGLFEYYNLLRGFDYTIKIHQVDAPGYDTLEAAARGTTFNNFGASVEARGMTNLSDGEDLIYVNFTSHVFTVPQDTVSLLAQYRVGINEPGNKGGTIRNDLLKIQWESGEVIGSITGPDTKTVNGAAWNRYFVKGADEPSDRLKQQTVYVYRGNRAPEGQPVDYGLYRVIYFFSHTPWSFEHIDTFPELWSDFDEAPWDWSENMREIDPKSGAPLTLFFELPSGLPQAIFPLEFVIESDRQNIQNAYIGNAVVRSVPPKLSLFATDPTLGNPPAAPTTPRIQYVKTVTWTEYYDGRDEEMIGTGSTIVRCRFRTITHLDDENVGSNEGDGSRSTTRLRVANPYFGRYDDKTGKWTMYHEDGFTRATLVTFEWDFSTDDWTDILNKMRTRYNTDTRYNNYDIYTESNNTGRDGLIFIDGTRKVSVQRWGRNVTIDAPTLTSGTDSRGRYVQTSSVNDILRHTQKYLTDEARTMRISVVSTDTNGNPAAPRIEFSKVEGGTVTAPSAPTTTTTESGTTTYVYDVSVPAKVSSLNVDIKAPITNANMRFYKISFLPRVE